METPNLVILSNGYETAAILDGAVIGRGIENIAFTASGGAGRIRLMDIDVEKVSISFGQDAIERIFADITGPVFRPPETQGKN